MTFFHALLGAAVILLNGATGVDGLVLHDDGERFWQVGGLAHGALALQLVSGFFLLTGTTRGLTFLHILLPAVAFVLVMIARSRDDEQRGRLVAFASLLACAVAVFAYASGVVAHSNI